MAVDLGSFDISCLKDFVSDCRVQTDTNLGVAEAIFRRLYTPRGRLIDDPNYGLDVAGYINADMSQQDLAALASAIKSECKKEDRVLDAVIGLVLGTNGVATLTIDLTLATGPYRLTLAVGGTTFALLSVT